MKKMNLDPPSGTRDFFADSVRVRDKAIQLVKMAFGRFGFEPMETPAFERIEILTGKYGEDERLIFKINKRGEKARSGEADLALRYDFTVPLARAIARYPDKTSGVFKRYQIGPVWRADRPAKGRFREFYQCDADIVGSSSPLADAEVILAMTSCLEALDLSNYVVHLNSRNLIMELMRAYGVPSDMTKPVLLVLDKLHKIGADGVLRELEQQHLSPKTIGLLIEDLRPGVQQADNVRARLRVSESTSKGWTEANEVLELVTSTLGAGKIVLAPFLTRGLDYYTGTIFEVFYGDTSKQDWSLSIAGGGRYDGLVGMFARNDIPACGGSLGLERILMLLDKSSVSTTAVQVLVTVWDQSFGREALGIASKLRGRGIDTELYLAGGSLRRQLQYASRRGIPLCVLFGPDESVNGQVTIKNMNLGTQCTFPLAEVADAVDREIRQTESP